MGKSKQHKGNVMCSSQEQTHTPVLCAVCDNLGNQSTARESHLIVSNPYRFIEAQSSPRGTGLPFPKGNLSVPGNGHIMDVPYRLL